jgi:peptidoglycan/xylan/chitin deacetylase (PgdA/CDA1 family)
VIWSVTCYDWRRTATRRSIARHASRADEGDIILLHDGSHVGPAVDRSRSLDATERILERFSERGFAFPTVPGLIAS